MKKSYAFSLIFFLIFIFLLVLAVIHKDSTYKESGDTLQSGSNKLTTIGTTTSMKLTSAAFKANDPIPSRYTCDGENINPPLSIEGVPAHTKTLALIVDDPDAPAGTWTHWTVWNIPSAQTRLEAGTDPLDAVQGMTSFGKPGYGGPCPPSGTHRYFFKLYALDTPLTLGNRASLSDLIKAMDGHILEKTELIGTYHRVQK